MNNLTVDNANSLNAQHLKPRKSIIGKLERSSFQAQRLSDVGIAFSQQITAKVGLRLPASQERIVEQTRWLYLRYVFVKLRQNKLPLRDLNLTKSSRARRAAALGATNEAQIIVSISEPPSADALTHSDVRPLFRRPNDTRKRSALMTNINSQDLLLLAARVNNKNKSVKRRQFHRQPECLDHSENKRIQQSSDDESTTVVSSSSTTGVSPTVASVSISSRLASAALNFHARHSDYASGGLASRRTSASSSSNMSSSSSSTSPNRKSFMMDPTINNQIFTVIMNMIKELRESKPELYGDTIYEMIGLDKFSSLESLLEVQKTLCQEMTRSEISWDRITALFSLFGAMSLDCVRLGAPEHVGPILDGFIGFVERDLALWISQQGGWESFLYKFRAGYHYGSLYKITAISIPMLIFWVVLFVYK